MKQNKYDDPQFFHSYSQMARSVEGLAAAGEWPAFEALLPDLSGKSVLDLGCGFGWHCRYARERGAHRVLGVDLSERMLTRAKAQPNSSGIEYKRTPIEDLDVGSEQFDIVISSLALHYVEGYSAVCRKVYGWLATRGAFVFSVEHPIFTALAAQQWCAGPAGERLHWPVDQYHEEGIRHTQWMADDVVKYHRTVATYVNGLVESGFGIAGLMEPTPTREALVRWPEWRDECRRPMFLLASAVKGR